MGHLLRKCGQDTQTGRPTWRQCGQTGLEQGGGYNGNIVAPGIAGFLVSQRQKEGTNYAYLGFKRYKKKSTQFKSF
uniref:HDC02501 n=1 Tax=Drosophila melanogaster TaxID=7227 RepID=Q6IHJ0_DROME|nr:TPA_inf: HDC02501 [Drosophila melanogaster]